MTDLPYRDRSWTSSDGLNLHFRDYAGPEDTLPVLCLHGLTRNSRDFAPLAEHICERHRVLVPEMRGRGLSDYAKDSATYTPPVYVADVEALLEQEGIERFVAIGTSMGGIMTMLMAVKDASRIAAAAINDIGPVVDPAGIDRIAGYVGQGRSFPTWMHAARALKDEHGDSFPEYDIETWLEMAKRTMIVGPNGRIALDYDMAIAEPFKEPGNAAPPDMWPAFEALGNTPLLVLRGELSDLLTRETLAEMQRRIPSMKQVTVPRIGHAPILSEPESLVAIDALLAEAK
ncbi:alpha/beta fold hydrolase [Altererythrobacter lutimaris]|uniref:Alpha/beta hydrolase n=1 Tax=Altererythrobacter lutimaris TaxID=2743979 RepID=A0A850HC46_9SPHN|nr:alpha/beta hydrolase [Altererythrobacter lutimaris]NVE94496.1 alpha/beta hydrolase [Altererythrobacter lutimaris]